MALNFKNTIFQSYLGFILLLLKSVEITGMTLERQAEALKTERLRLTLNADLVTV